MNAGRTSFVFTSSHPSVETMHSAFGFFPFKQTTPIHHVRAIASCCMIKKTLSSYMRVGVMTQTFFTFIVPSCSLVRYEVFTSYSFARFFDNHLSQWLTASWCRRRWRRVSSKSCFAITLLSFSLSRITWRCVDVGERNERSFSSELRLFFPSCRHREKSKLDEKTREMRARERKREIDVQCIKSSPSSKRSLFMLLDTLRPSFAIPSIFVDHSYANLKWQAMKRRWLEEPRRRWIQVSD